jgi:hypothetical protein
LSTYVSMCLRASPHYARTTCCDRRYGRPSLRAGGSVRKNAAGAACSRDRVARRRVVCSTKAHSRVIDGIAVRPCLVAGWLTKSRRPTLHRGERSGSGCALFRRGPCRRHRPLFAQPEAGRSRVFLRQAQDKLTLGRNETFASGPSPCSCRVARPSPRFCDSLSYIMRA